jgi:uncharacterized membrane protein
MNTPMLQRIKDFDEARPGFAGEHWLVLAAGVAVWLGTRRHPSSVVRLLGSVAGTVLVARAATGRKVPEKLLRWLPFEQRHPAIRSPEGDSYQVAP